MEDADTYALIQEVIPNKNCIPFRERFAKLTLSSHKKERAKPEKKTVDAELPSVSSVRRQLNKDNNILLPNKESYTDNSKKNTMASLIFTDDSFGHDGASNVVEHAQIIGDECSQLLSDPSKVNCFRENEDSSSREGSIITVSESGCSDNDQIKIKPFDETTKSSPKRLVNNSLDRIADFLRDVSITNKRLHDKNRESQLLNASEEAFTKAHLLAIADTESMHELLEEESDLFMQTSSISISTKSKQTNEKDSSLRDTVANISTSCNSIVSPNCNYNQSDESNSLGADNDINETVNSTQSESVNQISASIIIEDTDESTNEQRSIEENGINSQIIINDNNEDVDDSSEPYIQQYPKTNINISAKINIQINISSDQPILSTANHGDTGSCSKEANNTDRLTKTTSKLHQDEKLKNKCNKYGDKDLENGSNKSINIATSSCDSTHLSESNISDKTFDTLDAEKLLTELYGRSWQTPDVIHTIRGELSVSNKSRTNPSRKCLFRNIIESNGINENLVGKPAAISEEASPVSNRKYSSAEKFINRPNAYQTRGHRTDKKISKDVENIDDTNLGSAPENISACSPNVSSDPKANTKKSQRKQLKSRKNDLPKTRIQPLRNPLLILTENDQNKNRAAADKFNTDKKCVGGTLHTTKTKRRLFTPNYFDDISNEEFDKNDELITYENSTENDILEDKCYDPINNCFVQTKGNDFKDLKENRNHHGSNVKYHPEIPELDKVQPTVNEKVTSNSTKKNANSNKKILTHTQTPNKTYSFLKSLDECVSKAFCHPEALRYRENYRLRKDELSKVLYDLYNQRVFDAKLEVPIIWNKKLTNTAGRCLNKKRMSIRTCVIELSDKVLSSADRLRCTLLHEMCHAATWVFNGEGGHGATWKNWAKKANEIFPDIPKIGICHQYDIQYKYTYKCTTCGAKSHAHSKSKKVENIRCSYCHSSIEIFLNKITKDGNVVQTPVRQPNGFAKFVKDNYKKHKDKQLKHADIMKILSEEFAAIKVSC